MKDFRTDAEKLESKEMLARARANAVKVSDAVCTEGDDDDDDDELYQSLIAIDPTNC